MHACHADEEKNYVFSHKKTQSELVHERYRKRDFCFYIGKNLQDNKDIKKVGYGTWNAWNKIPTQPLTNCI